MTVIGETRVLPETLDDTWERLRAKGLPGVQTADAGSRAAWHGVSSPAEPSEGSAVFSSLTVRLGQAARNCGCIRGACSHPDSITYPGLDYGSCWLVFTVPGFPVEPTRPSPGGSDLVGLTPRCFQHFCLTDYVSGAGVQFGESTAVADLGLLEALPHFGKVGHKARQLVVEFRAAYGQSLPRCAFAAPGRQRDATVRNTKSSVLGLTRRTFRCQACSHSFSSREISQHEGRFKGEEHDDEIERIKTVKVW